MPAIIWPDIEAEFIAHMAPALQARTEPYAADVAVRNRVPDERGDAWPPSGRLVVVRDDGGPTTPDVRATARLGVQVWAASEAEASDLANLVMALTGGWRSPTVRQSNPSRPFSATEESGRPKQYFTAELMIRGRALPA
ncbi:hypothetical protein GCM10025865_01220 [Paraoerskovia sediminicola]|uniref:Tail terminator n=1 Tax=Paraoerskovia sediminicola TaxID=1138587 RepID=A0ABM8FYK9_9CELL|nr:hypothetical protein [Paraoerskovia sediminicola]BDZ40823.1 hypothetical protein GCM10025865_01220 [Paraoerskovia sediminicola]